MSDESKPPVAKIYEEPKAKPPHIMFAILPVLTVVFFFYVGAKYGSEFAWEALFLWFICGAIAAAIGKKKGVGTWGMWMGVMLGPLGIAIVVLSDGDRLPCPYCKEKIVNSATTCMHCKKELPATWATNHLPGGTKPG